MSCWLIEDLGYAGYDIVGWAYGMECRIRRREHQLEEAREIKGALRGLVS